jgi:hypothetical protein
MQARPDQNNDRAYEGNVEEEFLVTTHSVRRPDALMPLFPRKNIQKAHADPDDAHHQKYGGQNMLSHDNASSVVSVKSQKLTPEILALRAKSLFDYAV